MTITRMTTGDDCERPANCEDAVTGSMPPDQSIPAVCADIPQKGVRKSGTPNIIEVLAGLVSHDG